MPTTPSYPLPLLHLNGSGFDRLYNGYRSALDSAKEALNRLIMDVEFHGRDYYPLRDENSFERAREERNKHMRSLRDYISYLEEHLAHLADMQERRTRG